jgi:hypothetical protein
VGAVRPDGTLFFSRDHAPSLRQRPRRVLRNLIRCQPQQLAQDVLCVLA